MLPFYDNLNAVNIIRDCKTYRLLHSTEEVIYYINADFGKKINVSVTLCFQLMSLIKPTTLIGPCV